MTPLHRGDILINEEGKMKICITSQGDNLNAQVDPRFGRCEYFVLVDSDTLDYEIRRNPNAQDAGGAGVTSAQLMIDWGISVILTGNVGPKMIQVLRPTGIKIIRGVTGTVKEVMERYKNGEFR